MRIPPRSSRPKRVMVFDLDDTLYLERDFVLSGFAAVGRWARSQLGVDDLEATMVDCFRSGVQGRVFDEALRMRGLQPRPTTVARMLAVYRQHNPAIALADDALRILQRRPAELSFAIITDGFRDAQKRKLRALDVHRHGVGLALCTDRWGRDHWKPSPRAFEYVEACFGLSGAGLTYVADNPFKDFAAPASLGWHTIHIERPGRLGIHSGDQVTKAAQSINDLDDIAV